MSENETSENETMVSSCMVERSLIGFINYVLSWSMPLLALFFFIRGHRVSSHSSSLLFAFLGVGTLLLWMLTISVIKSILEDQIREGGWWGFFERRTKEVFKLQSPWYAEEFMFLYDLAMGFGSTYEFSKNVTLDLLVSVAKAVNPTRWRNLNEISAQRLAFSLYHNLGALKFLGLSRNKESIFTFTDDFKLLLMEVYTSESEPQRKRRLAEYDPKLMGLVQSRSATIHSKIIRPERSKRGRRIQLPRRRSSRTRGRRGFRFSHGGYYDGIWYDPYEIIFIDDTLDYIDIQTEGDGVTFIEANDGIEHDALDFVDISEGFSVDLEFSNVGTSSPEPVTSVAYDVEASFSVGATDSGNDLPTPQPLEKTTPDSTVHDSSPQRSIMDDEDEEPASSLTTEPSKEDSSVGTDSVVPVSLDSPEPEPSYSRSSYSSPDPDPEPSYSRSSYSSPDPDPEPSYSSSDESYSSSSWSSSDDSSSSSWSSSDDSSSSSWSSSDDDSDW